MSDLLSAILECSLRNRLIVLIASMVALAYGIFLGFRMPIDVFPDLDRPRVVIITEAPGMATEEVETLVTLPIELALMGASGVQDVRSQTTSGLNVVYVEFDWSTEVRAARQTVSERLATLTGSLPVGIQPQMTPPASIMGQIVVAGAYLQRGPRGGRLTTLVDKARTAELILTDGEATVQLWRVNDRANMSSWAPLESQVIELTADTNRPNQEASAIVETPEGRESVVWRSESDAIMELRTTADWVIRPQLAKIAGVAEVLLQGGDQKQYQILLDPTALLEYDVTVHQVVQALRESNINTSGGFAITGETERPIRILGRLGTGSTEVLDDLREIPVVRYPKRTVLLDQVATVSEGAQFKRGDGSINGRAGVVMTIVKQPHVDTRRLTREITSTLETLEATLPANIRIQPSLFRLSKFIDRGITNVIEALILGAALVVIVLMLFLMNWRTTLITLTAIPLSLAITVIVFRLTGWIVGSQFSINVMFLGGIAVAMGELVDDAIVDVENIHRRLKLAHLSSSRADENTSLFSHHQSLIRIVFEASKEIRSAIMFGTLVVILVFLPLFALSGVEGRLFKPLAIAYIVSILASFLISVTVTPVLSSYLLGASGRKHDGHDGLVLRGLKSLAKPLIRTSMVHPKALLGITWIAVAAAGWQAVHLGRDFLPSFDEGSVQVNVTLPPGSSLQASNQVSANIDAVLSDLKVGPENPDGQILHFVRRTGRAELDEHASPVNFGEYILSMNPDSSVDRSEVISGIRERLEKEVPGVSIEAEQPLAHLISHMVSGVYAQIAIKVYGEDLDQLVASARSIQSALDRVQGITAPMIEPIQMTPELHIRLRGEDLAYYGLTRQYVADTLHTALQGEVVSEVLIDQRRFELMVRLEENYRTDYENLGRLRIDLPHLQNRNMEFADGRDAVAPERGQVELRDIATIEKGTGPNAINRENARRRVVIRCNADGRDLAGAVAAIRQRIEAEVDLPIGYVV
ncbi:MAG: efflux RND transporter permease subunit, partial [Planctomycetota bacterium]